MKVTRKSDQARDMQQKRTAERYEREWADPTKRLRASLQGKTRMNRSIMSTWPWNADAADSEPPSVDNHDAFEMASRAIGRFHSLASFCRLEHKSPNTEHRDGTPIELWEWAGPWCEQYRKDMTCLPYQLDTFLKGLEDAGQIDSVRTTLANHEWPRVKQYLMNRGWIDCYWKLKFHPVWEFSWPHGRYNHLYVEASGEQPEAKGASKGSKGHKQARTRW